MTTNYFRVTAYHPTENLSVILDSNGKCELLWQLSSAVVLKDFKVLAVASADKFLDGNITKTERETNRFVLRAFAKGEPERIIHQHNGVTYQALRVANGIYIPDKNKRA